jgi:lysozyme
VQTSEKGLALIRQFEGLRLSAYKCPANVATIGYGSTAGVKMGQTITREEAELRLRADVQRFADHVAALVTVPLSQNQVDALVSFVYNVGPAAFASSTMLKLINRGLLADAANQFTRWNRGGGEVLAGLTRRRIAERDLFLKPPAA